MSEYIDKEALAKFLANTRKRLPHDSKDFFTRDEMLLNFEQIVRATPAADVEPVKHGRWIGKRLDNFKKYQVTCSECGWIGIENYDSYVDPSDFNYCPNCGANMEYEEDDP